MVISKNNLSKPLKSNGGKKKNGIGDRVAWKRKSMGLQARELAEMLDVHPTSLSMLEVGKVGTPRYIKKLAEALEVEIDWLLTGDLESSVKKPSGNKALFGCDTLTELNPNYDYHVVRIKKGEKLFTPKDVDIIGPINKTLIDI
jgi:transcriptional regulator with XRE-family HTH domain